MDIYTIMIIVWAVIIIASLVIEVFSCQLVSIWFAPAAILPIILSAVGVDPGWQVLAFVILSAVLVASLRPLLKKFLIKPTIPTNITDVNIGKHVRLTQDSADGISLITINGVEWTAKVDGPDLTKGTMVEITGSESNKFIVKAIET